MANGRFKFWISKAEGWVSFRLSLRSELTVSSWSTLSSTVQLLFGTDSTFGISDWTWSCKSSFVNSLFSLSSLILTGDLNSNEKNQNVNNIARNITRIMSYLLLSTSSNDCFSDTPVDSFEIGIRHSLDLEFLWAFLIKGSGGMSGVFGLSRENDLRDEFLHFDINISLWLFASFSFMIRQITPKIVSFKCVDTIKDQNMLNPT